MTKQKNWNGKKSLLIQVDGNTVDIQKTPELYKAGLLSLASQIFSKSSTYGIVRLRVFRNGLWVYGASMIRGRTTKHEFYVQQDWRCKDPIFAIPKY